MNFLKLIFQIIYKNYMVTSFIGGYLFVYLLSLIVPSYFYDSPSVVLPFLYDSRIQNVDSILAEENNKKLNRSKILCWVMTYPANFETKAKHIKATWGSRCDYLLFMSSKSESTLPVIGLPVIEGYETLWAKTKAASYYVYKHYRHKADWFLKADDDTFVVVENLRHLLDKHNADSPIYFGRRFKMYVEQGYMSGGAGYVLSRRALKLFIEKGLKALFSEMCNLGMLGPEDINLGECLSYTGVTAGDSRDERFLETFHPFTVDLLLNKEALEPDNWIYSYCYYPLQVGENCCSNHTISFHYVEPEVMYVYDYFVHILDIYGTKNYIYQLDTGLT